MQQKRIYLWLAGISFLLILLIGIQLVWLRNAARIQAEETRLHILRALEKTEGIVKNQIYCFEMYSKGFVGANEGIYIVRQRVDSNEFVGKADTLAFFMDMASYRPDTPFYKVGPLYTGYPMSAEIHANFRLEISDTGIATDVARTRYENFKGPQFKDMLSTSRPLDSLFNMKFADSVLAKSLAEENIKTPYGFAFIYDENNKVAYSNRVKDTAGLLRSPYQLKVFNDNKFLQPHRLAIMFTGNLNMNAGNYWLYISIIIIAVLAISFYFFVRLYIRQTQLSEMKSDFINNLTHEFNTPMANISLALETLTEQDHVKDPKVERIFNIISTESGRLQENIERALQVATMEKGNLHLHIEQVDLVATINTIISAYQLQSEQLGGSITFTHPARCSISADETHLLNCICNLLENAVKYRLGPPHIHIILEDKDDHISLSVSDNGKGMSSETQKHIFNKFYRAHEGDTHDTKGFGLGLSYVKGIIDAHRGRISVWSKPGAGTKFTIILPKNKVYA